MDYSSYTLFPPPKLSLKRLKSYATLRSNPESPTSSPSEPVPSPPQSPGTATMKTTTMKTTTKSKGNEEYENLLDSAVHGLQTDFTSGARQMADAALSNLATLIDLAASTARDRDELWSMAVEGAKKLSFARPAMSAAITSCMLRALSSIDELWNAETRETNKSPSDLSRMAAYRIDQILLERKEASAQLGKNVTFWIEAFSAKVVPAHRNSTIRILTLSNSSSIRTAVLAILEQAPTIHLIITILESRPRFEGADMAAQLLAAAQKMVALPRIQIKIAPDCAVGNLVRDVDIVLLGADRISSLGDVSNKIGSLTAACCAKTLNSRSRVVVVSDGDKIVAPGAEHGPVERHPAEEVTGTWKEEVEEELKTTKMEVFGEWFEWVPKQFVDVYITETGILDRQGVEEVGKSVGELEEKFFGEMTWQEAL